MGDKETTVLSLAESIGNQLTHLEGMLGENFRRGEAKAIDDSKPPISPSVLDDIIGTLNSCAKRLADANELIRTEVILRLSQ